jgi:hypothetical protein
MKIFQRMLYAMAIVLPLVGIVGCETESSSQADIRITPNTASLTRGASQEFVASGWQDYTWSLSDNDAGVLSNTTGDRTTYTAVASLGSNQTQVLTVTVSISTTGTGTNSTTRTFTAEALIRHL